MLQMFTIPNRQNKKSGPKNCLKVKYPSECNLMLYCSRVTASVACVRCIHQFSATASPALRVTGVLEPPPPTPTPTLRLSGHEDGGLRVGQVASLLQGHNETNNLLHSPTPECCCQLVGFSLRGSRADNWTTLHHKTNASSHDFHTESAVRISWLSRRLRSRALMPSSDLMLNSVLFFFVWLFTLYSKW